MRTSVLQAREDIRQFEQELADSGAVIVKFWLHISKREQKKRFKQLLASRATAWKIGKAERRQHRHYDQWLPAVEEMITQTNSRGRAVDDCRSHAAAFRPGDGVSDPDRSRSVKPWPNGRRPKAAGKRRSGVAALSRLMRPGHVRHDPRPRRRESLLRS